MSAEPRAEAGADAEATGSATATAAISALDEPPVHGQTLVARSR